jgi:DNA polymerase-1
MGSSSLLYLIDGDGLLYRAAFALPYRANAAGLPVHALHGFAAMLRRLLRDHAPTHAAVAFTADPPLRRHAIDPRYKIDHAEHPEDIKLQLPYAMRLVAALGLHAFREAGYEADDVIATLQHRHRTLPTRIVSNDRDFYQLVSPRVRLLVPVRGVTRLAEIGPADVVAQWGVAPAQVPDLKALVGDPSDDIPGVPGIGIKTAARLLRSHASVEQLLARLDGLPPTDRRRLEPMRDRILLNKRLALLGPVRLATPAGSLRRTSPHDAILTRLARETGVRSIAP